MHTVGYIITRQDAQVIKELLSFLGEDVFDQRQSDGSFGKSDPFLRMIRDARSVLEEIEACDGAKPEGERQ
ncbi:hypothetical protein [Rhizobium rhizogenes]|uniref:hypothetical protein n=1 Tax=Rhizobium rhizogenes TaxID=359 RepID=UPI00157276A1|nr:hypothetical protein [Rhizobium rhizogenes]NTF43054.1 hypothetical protein [Rhizobium rhizogenes]